MLRNVLAVVAGYVAIVLFVMITFSVAWILLGQSFAFEAGTANVTTGWIAIALVLSGIASVLGGYLCALISRRPGGGAVTSLAVLIFVLGIVTAVMHLAGHRPETPADLALMGTFEAAQYAIQPTWYEFTVAIIGAAGAIIGGRLPRRSATVASLV